MSIMKMHWNMEERTRGLVRLPSNWSRQHLTAVNKSMSSASFDIRVNKVQINGSYPLRVNVFLLKLVAIFLNTPTIQD